MHIMYKYIFFKIILYQIFKDKASEPVTPGNMAMKIFREEKPVEAATPDQLAMKKIFKEQKPSVPVTPGNAAMKIFKEEKETGPMTPDQDQLKFYSHKKTLKKPRNSIVTF